MCDVETGSVCDVEMWRHSQGRRQTGEWRESMCDVETLSGQMGEWCESMCDVETRSEQMGEWCESMCDEESWSGQTADGRVARERV